LHNDKIKNDFLKTNKITSLDATRIVGTIDKIINGSKIKLVVKN